MAIDPRTYEKYSGRKGDPMTRKGSALSKDAVKAASREARVDPGSIEYHTAEKGSGSKVQLVFGIIIVVGVLLLLAFNI